MRSKLMEREHIFFDWIKNDSRVLDIGCGNSRLLYELQEKKHCTGTGIDTSSLVIEGQQKAGINAYIADIESGQLAIQDNYDYIVMSELLEHLREPENLIPQLKPHARYLVVSVPNSAFYRYRLGLLFRGRFFTQWVSHPSEHLRFWSHKDFLDWLEALDVEVVATQASNGFWFKDLWPNLFGHQMCYLVKTRE